MAFSPGVLFLAPVTAPSAIIELSLKNFTPIQKATSGGINAPAIPITASHNRVSPCKAVMTLGPTLAAKTATKTF